MAASGFEGFEKRLELHFAGGDDMGLRELPVEHIAGMLEAVQCSIVSSVGNRHFDAYVLSESSLFIFPNKIVIKTCGTTQLLKSIPFLLPVAGSLLGLRLRLCRYSRGSFIFPESQPFPHTSFRDEVSFLENILPESLRFRKARTFDRSWHVFSASDRQEDDLAGGGELVTVEMCMTQLDRAAARRFFRSATAEVTGFEAGIEMTAASGIAGIDPDALICEYGFDPCGYSMNGLGCGGGYSTIHVTPEEGFSYASFECAAAKPPGGELAEILAKVVEIFRPGSMSVSLCFRRGAGAGDVAAAVEEEIEATGRDMKCWAETPESFPGAGLVHYMTFAADRRK